MRVALAAILVCGLGMWTPATRPAQAPGGAPAQAPPSEQAPPSAQSPPLFTQAPPAESYSGPVIVLDPGHGGTDTGARGDNGLEEKDIVLEFAQTVRGELEHDGYRVLMTRSDDSNPSYDERAALANAFRDALFISLHVSTTGAFGTARAYYYRFASAYGVSPVAGAAPPLTLWSEAQRTEEEASHRLADLMQEELAQRFSGSPAAASGAAVRELRSVAAPAVAVEVSSVAPPSPEMLRALGQPLASAIGQTLETFHPASSMGTK
jgi:N-acetylmuramoyl-L-alanine amidase